VLTDDLWRLDASEFFARNHVATGNDAVVGRTAGLTTRLLLISSELAP